MKSRILKKIRKRKLVNKWKPILEFKSSKLAVLPKNQYANVAELLEFTERMTRGRVVVPDDEWIRHMQFVDMPKVEIPWVRMNYKNLTIDDLFAKYL